MYDTYKYIVFNVAYATLNIRTRSKIPIIYVISVV